jgi:hypothetical protein
MISLKSSLSSYRYGRGESNDNDLVPPLLVETWKWYIAKRRINGGKYCYDGMQCKEQATSFSRTLLLL